MLRFVHKCLQQLCSNSQNLEMPKVSINKRMHKEIVVHPYDGTETNEVLIHSTT